MYILGGHAELNSPFLVTDRETLGGNINKSVITMVGLNIGAGSAWTPGSDIIQYNGSGALVFIGGRFTADGAIRVENPLSYPNPSVLCNPHPPAVSSAGVP